MDLRSYGGKFREDNNPEALRNDSSYLRDIGGSAEDVLEDLKGRPGVPPSLLEKGIVNKALMAMAESDEVHSTSNEEYKCLKIKPPCFWITK